MTAPNPFEGVPLGDLRVRYGLAQTSLRFSQEPAGRLAAMSELEQLREEFKRRGYQVPA